jgi:hypothetical protein
MFWIAVCSSRFAAAVSCEVLARAFADRMVSSSVREKAVSPTSLIRKPRGMRTL